MANSSKSIVPLIGRILMSVIFLTAGIGKFAAFTMMSGYVASKGVPLPHVATALAASIEVLLGLAILLGFQAKIAAWVLFVYLIPVTLLYHNFWTMSGMERMDNQIHFMKNLAIMGGLLILAANGSGAYSVSSGGEAKV